MIRLITGLPGAGKSLRAVWYISEAEKAGRPVYVAGVDGLSPGDWESCDPNRWQDLPDGALIVVDEAQKVWPTRRVGEPPAHIRALSEHRHRGFDFILLTQHPAMVDKYVRTLVGEHQHVIRQFGTQTAKLVTWSECYEDPQSLVTRQRGTESLWRYPRALFGRYKSASMHTVKARLPTRLLLLPVGFLVMLVCAYFGYRSVSGIGSAVAESAPAAAITGARSSVPGTLPPDDYVARLIPRVAGQPWTAPVFDGLEVQAEPEIYCVDIDDGAECRCYTEQITRLLVPRSRCRAIAHAGVYNPFRAPWEDQELPATAQLAATSSASSASVAQRETVGPRYRPIDPAGEGSGSGLR